MTINQRKVLALIPARGGSKGIKNKNLISVNGKKLIDFTINEAKKSEFIDEVFVSSDSQEILDHSKRLNVNTLKRPKKYATDTSTANDVVWHFYRYLLRQDELSNSADFYLIYLQPTSPLRRKEHIDESLSLLKQTGIKSVVSITKDKYTPFKSFTKNKSGHIKALFDESMTYQSRQILPQTYRPNGAIYIFLFSLFISNKGFPSNGSIGYEMPDAMSMDIDTPEDLEELQKHRLL